MIWILDDKLFNKRTLRASEKFLRQHASYFVSTHFFFYDQLELFSKNKRIKKGRKMGVDFSKIFYQKGEKHHELPSPFQERFSIQKVFFEGDLLFCANAIKETLSHWVKMEKELPKERRIQSIFDAYVKKPYLEFLNFLLRNGNR